MTSIEQKCNQCSALIQISEDYSSPFVKCPECGSMQRYVKANAENEPKYKLSGKTGGLKSVKMPVKVVDESKTFVDAVGQQGLKEVYKQVAAYMIESNVSRRRNLKSKIMQNIMRKYRITSDVASHMLDFAEKSDETQDIMATKSRNSKLFVVILGVLAVAVVGGIILAFL